jgi:hypothetical protein
VEMSDSDKNFIDRLEAMPIEQARREIALGAFGRPGSPNHSFALSWLSVNEAERRDKRDALTESISRKALRNSNWANIIAISAIIIAIIAIIVPFLTKK